MTKPAPTGRRRHHPAAAVEILIESPSWAAQPQAEAIVRGALAQAALMLPPKPGEIAVVLSSDEAVRALNLRWRRIDAPTNVLSFPAPPQSSTANSDRNALPPLGGIAIAYETVAREATAEGKPFGDHLAHLAVHGFLHLFGYDHDSDAAAQDMERLEARILERLGVPDPYLTRDGT
jgi:probable rRNA maturation factor